jgi:uncharacterized protein DUF3306
MTGPDNFLSRWARRKREAEAPSSIEPPRAVQCPVHTTDTPEGGHEMTGVPPQGGAAAEPRFDLATLPSVESITETTDIRGFLTSGVPAELTRSALRRAWSSDPSIRDFIGIAENQWDFNDPNAIAGFGPLRGNDDVPALLAQALGRIDKITEAMPDPTIANPPTSIAVVAPQQLVEQTPDGISPGDPGIGASRSVNDDTEGLPQSSADSAKGDHPPPRRQHGGALPRSDS